MVDHLQNVLAAKGILVAKALDATAAAGPNREDPNTAESPNMGDPSMNGPTAVAVQAVSVDLWTIFSPHLLYMI